MERYELFRKNLTTVRRALGIKQQDLSRDCNFKQLKRIADIEIGRGKIRLDEVIAICGRLDVSMEDMLFTEASVIFQWKDPDEIPF